MSWEIFIITPNIIYVITYLTINLFTGRVTLGSGPNVDIPVQGTGVQPLHCHIENSSGVVTLYPQADQISVDGVRVTCPTRLAQGMLPLVYMLLAVQMCSTSYISYINLN